MKYLTGEFRFRNEGKLLVLQVRESKYEPEFGGMGRDIETWRDAGTEDLLNIQFCPPRNIEPIQMWPPTDKPQG